MGESDDMPKEDLYSEDIARYYDEVLNMDMSESSKAYFSTLKRDARPTRPAKTFTGRMAFYFVMTAVMCVAIFTVVLATVWEQQFQGYARDNMQRLAQQTADALSSQYEESGGWTPDVVGYAPAITAAYPDLGMQVLDASGNVLYDDTTVNRKSSSDEGASPNDINDQDNVDSIVSADVLDRSGIKLGTVRLWAFDAEAVTTKSDAAFKMNSYYGMALAGVIAIALAGVIGYCSSRTLTRPVVKITSTARAIRNGDLTARTNLKGDDEIGRLGETFDSMATELERDIKFEHRLTSDVAHELRTPLMAMLATVEAMQDGVLPSDNEHFEVVAGEVRRLSRLVDAMLHLSRVENNTDFKTERTEMVYVVKSLVSMQEQLFNDRGLRLRFDDKIPTHELYADVNPDLIREAVTNIMSNAMRYTPEGGWVVVAIDRDRFKNEMLISVRDTGIGIAKEDIPRVFSRFWRSDASRERVSGGLGVGLALTKEIIDKHNGSIGVESELGKGTTFTLRIPIDRDRSYKPNPSGEELIG
ncbi:Signal transduction histidine kinase [Olsenella sp. KH1P3]|uniref:histidine kinase n=2 Tax=Coriobacteriales TaxID=84999 RepID=A0A1H6IFE1_9ACTN|nr:Signal transduction histidine kinase [Parafannyhessea umbonata]SJZ68991.1 Signal transduction histidine kinase [Olsenella sp. KH1P3]